MQLLAHAVGNRALLGGLLLVGGLAIPASAGKSRPAAPSPAPLVWSDLDGRKTGPAEIASHPATVLVFTSTTCPCAERYNGRVQELAARFEVPFSLVFTAESPADVRAYAGRKGLTLPLVVDPKGALADRLGARATPTAVVLDRAGTVRYRGRIDDNPDPQAVERHDLRDALVAVLKQSPVARARTPAVGCAVGEKKADAPERPVRLEEGLGRVDFPVTCRDREVQRYFNQGMARWFGFNFPEAERTFREVVRRDPSCAMGYWGIALSMGMSYNFDFNPARLGEASEAVAKALELCSRTTPREQALIRALAVRNGPGKQMLRELAAYRDAMARVYYSHPEDANIATLYAASLMDLNPWTLWTADGQPKPGTMEAILVLEQALRRDPEHIGAHHYLIHATEASPTPGRALESARRLGHLAPRSGHLFHMPAHTFFRVGDYSSSNGANRKAADLDAEYFAEVGKPTAYGGYYTHNLDFLVAGYMFQGQSAQAVSAARELARAAAQWTPEQAAINCGTVSGIMGVFARFGKWDEILSAPPAPADNPFSVAMWRYARGMAELGKGNRTGAEKELALLEQAGAAAEKAVPDIPIPGFSDGLRGSFRIARLHLRARVALAQGRTDEGLGLLRSMAEEEDRLPYFEPPLWRHPARESLGAALHRLGRFAEAETAFRDGLERHPKSGRCLFGLAASLEAQGKQAEAARVREEFRKAWSLADGPVRMEDL